MLAPNPKKKGIPCVLGALPKRFGLLLLFFLLSYFKKYLDLHDIQKKTMYMRACVCKCMYTYTR